MSACFLLSPQRLRPRIVTVASTLGTTRVLTLAYRNTLAATLIFFMQAGFSMLEAGIVHPKNVTNILFKNMIDASLAAFIFWAIGYGIAYGKCSSLLSACLALCIASQILLGVGRT